MWNPDQTYMAEQARRAELEAEAQRERLIRASSAAVPDTTRIAEVLRWLAELLANSLALRPRRESHE